LYLQAGKGKIELFLFTGAGGGRKLRKEPQVKDTINVAYVAELARIELTPEEQQLFQRQLETVVRYVEKIGRLELSGIEPTQHGQNLVNVFREDQTVAAESEARELFLANAPERNGYEFRLPKIVEEA
jgi:aspartyl-tRNA(Asn)/glutamyl-tRNA(Gln) amidotransferase subunit C